MAKLTADEVKHVAKLAKLNLTDAEIKKYASQLSVIVEYISELSKVDTSDIEPTSQTTGLENVKRPDMANASNYLSQGAALSGTDSAYNGYFKVKAILSERSDK